MPIQNVGYSQYTVVYFADMFRRALAVIDRTDHVKASSIISF